MIEIGQELFSLNQMEDKGAQGNEWFIRSGQNLLLSTISPGHDIGCIDSAEHQD